MKKILFIICLLLTGCEQENVSPSNIENNCFTLTCEEMSFLSDLLDARDKITAKEILEILIKNERVGEIGGGSEIANNYSTTRQNIKNPDGTNLLHFDDRPIYRQHFSIALVEVNTQSAILLTGVQNFISISANYENGSGAPFALMGASSFPASTGGMLLSSSGSQIRFDAGSSDDAVNIEIDIEFTLSAD